MLILNPLTGQLFDKKENRLVANDEVLMFIRDLFTVNEDLKHRLTLHSFRKMFECYPALMALNGWADDFMAFDYKKLPRFVLLNNAVDSNSCDKLFLQRKIDVADSELTFLDVDFIEKSENVINIDGSRTRTFSIKMDYKDQPSIEIDDSTDLFYIKDNEVQSLSFTRLDEIYWKPIEILNAQYSMTKMYANADRSSIGHSEVSDYIQETPELKLDSVIHTILMDVNLDDEEVFEAEQEFMNEVMERIEETGFSVDGDSEKNKDD